MIQFKQGTRAQWEALATKDSETLYFLSDTHQIAKGGEIYVKSYEVVAALPETAVAKKDVLYVVTGEKALYTFNGTEFAKAFDTKDALDTTVSKTGINAVSGAAVYSFVATEIGKLLGGETGVIVTEVKAKEDAVGTLVVTTGNGSSEVVLKDLVHNVKWDSGTRNLTFEQTGAADIVIPLGVDMVVKSGEYVAASNEIVLTLSNDDVVRIPVTALVDIYTSGSADTDTVKIVVSSQDNTIKATIAIDNSSIQADETGKLFVDFTAVNAAIKVAADKADANEEAIAALTTRVVATEAFETRIAANETQIAKNKKAHADNKTLIDGLTTRLNAAEPKITTLEGKVDVEKVSTAISTAIKASEAATKTAYEAADTSTLNTAKSYADGLLTWKQI